MKVIELYKLVSDGKAPEKIIYNGKAYKKNIAQDDYETFTINHYEYLMDDINTFEQLNDEIEIIEEPKKIEKLNLDKDELLKNVIITAQDYVIEGKINEIIDYILEKES